MLMHSLLLAPILLALSVLSTPAPDPVAQATPQQTIVPFASLPACAELCGPLFDAQGACSPPVVSVSSDSCFCAYESLQPFYSSATGVCPNACPQDPEGLTRIQSWFLSLCKPNTLTTTTTSSTATATTTGSTAPTNAGSTGGSNNGPSASSTGQAWLSTHYQYVIMIVVIAIAIAVGWIGAYILKKRYDRRKEREFELRPPAVPWVAKEPGARKEPYVNGTSNGLVGGPNKEAGGNAWATPASNIKFQSEKPEKKKWIVKERT